MKKSLVTVLLVSALLLTVTACNTGNGRVSPFGDETDETTHETSEEVRPVFDLSNLPPVDATETFGEYRVNNFSEAWGASQNLRMSDGSIRNFFCDYAFDGGNNLVNENLNYVATLKRPTVTVFDASKEGYIVYEVVYSQIFPICSKEPSYVSRSFFSYHGVGYLDFYTGTIIPTINLSTQIDSFSVTGTVVYNGKSYDVSYYEYREDEVLESSSTSTNDGYILQQYTVQINSTSYFVVPEGYDGILMFVYVANDTNRPIDEVLADDDPYFTPPEPFGDDENVDDYVFIGINAPM